MKAIETIYKGYRFRSRLEARWAVFFDAIGAEWEYEPEGYVLSDGTYYLPDFLLHNVYGRGASEIYVEIKGVITKEDLNKIELFSYGDGNSVESIYGGPYIAENPIIIFGKIPEERIHVGYWYKQTVGGPDNYHLEDRYQPPYRYLDFGDRGQETRFYDLVYSDGDDGYFTEPWAKKGGGLVLDYLDDPYVEIIDRELTFEAYRKARQARFEHGEKP